MSMKAINLVGVAVFAGGLVSDQNLILLLGLFIQILSILIELLRDRDNKKGSSEKEAVSKPV